jgi:hypothetical protein
MLQVEHSRLKRFMIVLTSGASYESYMLFLMNFHQFQVQCEVICTGQWTPIYLEILSGKIVARFS